MGYKFNPFTGNFDATDSPNGEFESLDVSGDINLDDGGTYETTVQVVTPTANRTISFPDATGTVALVAGSNQAVQYNSAGATAGDSGLLYNATSGSLTVGGKTVTTDAPIINLSQTWNSAGTTFTGLKLNVTNTASASTSNLLDLQVGGASIFSVGSVGNTSTSYAIRIGGSSALWSPYNGALAMGTVGNVPALSVEGGLGAGFTSAGLLWWTPSASSGPYSQRDVVLARDAAGTLAQRNGTAAQTFRLYNTWANNGVDFERTSITRDSSGLVIDAQKGGTGTVDPTNLLDLQVNGTSRLYVSPAGIGYLPTSGGDASAFIFGGTSIANAAAYTGQYGFRLKSTNSLTWSSGQNLSVLDIGLARSSAGVVKVTDGSTGTGYVKQDPVAISALPAAGTVGAGTRGFVNDASSTTFAAEVAVGTNDGGSTVVPVYSDGSTWRIG